MPIQPCELKDPGFEDVGIDAIDANLVSSGLAILGATSAEYLTARVVAPIRPGELINTNRGLCSISRQLRFWFGFDMILIRC